MSLTAELRAVPEPILDGLTSEDAINSIIYIEDHYQLPPDEVSITRALRDLVLKKITVADIKSRVASELQLTSATSLKVYEDIKRLILAPVASDLLAYGIGKGELDSLAPAPTGVPLSPTTATLPSATPVRTETVTLPGVIPSSTRMPTPVPLRQDTLASQQLSSYKPSQSSLGSFGDISARGSSSITPQRSAQVDLGISSTHVDDTLQSIFVHKETPLPQQINYGVPPTTPSPLGDIPIAVAPLSGDLTPSPLPAMPDVTPSVEVVSLPAAGATPERSGFVDAIMHRVAPWHYQKFGSARAVADTAPSATVDYREQAAPVAPPTVDQIPVSLPSTADTLPPSPRG